MKITFNLIPFLFLVGSNLFAQSNIGNWTFEEEISAEKKDATDKLVILDQRLTNVTYHSFATGRYDSIQYFYVNPMDSIHNTRTGYRKNENDIFDYNFSDTLTFDEQNRIKSVFSYQWNSNENQFVKNANSQTEFDADGNSSRIYQKYNSELEKWENANKTENTYFKMPFILKETKISTWDDDSSQWKLNYDNLYNKDGFLVENVSYYFDPSDGTKFIIERDENNQTLKETTLYLDTINHVFIKSNLSVYERVNDTLVNRFNYDWIDNEWVVSSKAIIIYNSDNNILSYTALDSIGPGDYINRYMSNREYDAFGNEILHRKSDWNFDSNTWQPFSENTQTFDNNHHLLNWKTAYWDEDSAKLMVKFDRNYDYNSFGNRTHYIKYQRDLDSQNWSVKYEAKWVYEDFENGLSNSEEVINDFLVYPNPCSDFLIFESNSDIQNFRIQVYSYLGQFQFEKNIANHQQIDIHFLASGCYFYVIRRGDSSVGGWFVKD